MVHGGRDCEESRALVSALTRNHLGREPVGPLGSPSRMVLYTARSSSKIKTMESQSTRRVARIDQPELSSLPYQWSDQERGRHLRRLLRGQGIQPEQLYQIEYYPRQRCWIIVQEASQPLPRSRRTRLDDTAFYHQARAELQRAARTAFSRMAAHSSHFACTGSDYELPPRPEELAPSELVHLLGGPRQERTPVRFDSEGSLRTPNTN